jgi:hypothetical protein
MSALALETSRFFYLAINAIIYALTSVKKFFGIIAESFMNARQMQANYELAQILKSTGDYNNVTFDHLLYMINQGKLDELTEDK